MYELVFFPLSDALLIAAICQLGIFIIFLVLNRKGDWRLNLILALVLFFQVVPVASMLVLFHSYHVDYYPMAHIGNAAGFCIGPLLLLYLRKYLANRFFYLKTDISHFALFLFALVLLGLIAKSQGGNYTRRSVDIIYTLCLFLYTLLYFVFSLKMIIRSRKGPGCEQHSVFWPVFLFVGSLVLLFGRFMIFFLWEICPWNKLSPMTFDLYFLLTPHSVSLYFVVFIFFTNILILLALSGVYVIKNQTKYKHSRLSANGKIQFEKRIRELMEKERPYLDPLLSLDCLAHLLHISPKELSQIINECFAMNFSDFVNSFRVKEVILLFERESGKRTILDMSLEAGFNSKSTFNHVFKKYTGLSPREYLKGAVRNK
jgi:AraC-like DNA-binding protein